MRCQYELSFLSSPWRQPWKHLCDQSPWLYNGIRNRENAELCTWRRYHDRSIRCIECIKCNEPAGNPGNPCGSGWLYGTRRCDRACGLPSAAKCFFAAGSSDHSDRCQLPAAEHSASDLWCGYRIFSEPDHTSGTFSGRRKSCDLFRYDRHDRGVYRDHGRSDPLHQ